MSYKLNISISADADMMHVYAVADGDDPQEMKIALEQVLETYAGDRLTVIRNEPEVISERDFDTKELQIRGVVRFSVAHNHKGKREYRRLDAPIGFGAA